MEINQQEFRQSALLQLTPVTTSSGLPIHAKLVWQIAKSRPATTHSYVPMQEI